MPEIKYKDQKQDVLDYQKNQSRKAQEEAADERQKALVDLAVNSAIRTTVENMVAQGNGSFEQLNERGLISEHIDPEYFDKVTSLQKSLNTDHDIETLVDKYVSHGVIVNAVELGSNEELAAYKQERDDFDAKDEAFRESLGEYRKYKQEEAIRAAMDEQNYDNYRDKKSKRFHHDDEPVAVSRPQYPTDENGDPIKVPIDPRLARLNEMSDIQIDENGIKGDSRTNEKIDRELGGDHTQLTDKTRLTILTSSPKAEERFVQNMLSELKDSGEEQAVFDTTTEIKSSGYISRKLIVGFAQGLSELKLVDNEIYDAEQVTHLAYDAQRKMMDEDGNFKPQGLDEDALKEIKLSYNAVMEEVRESHDVTAKLFQKDRAEKYKDFDFSDKLDDKSFEGDELKERFEELDRLRQTMHVSAALFTSPSFKESYFNGLKRQNTHAKSDVFPEDLIPPREIIETSNTEKIMEYIMSDEINEAKDNLGFNRRQEDTPSKGR